MELKPCPFCGSRADAEERGLHTTIDCRGCGASIYADTDEKAAQAWNRRATDSDTEFRRLVLEGLCWLGVAHAGEVVFRGSAFAVRLDAYLSTLSPQTVDIPAAETEADSG